MESLITILVVLAAVAAAGVYGYIRWRRKEAELDFVVTRSGDDDVDLYDELDSWEIRRVDRGGGAGADGRADEDMDLGDLGGLRADPEDHAPARRPPPAPEPPAPGRDGGRHATGPRPSPARDEYLIIALSLLAPADAPYPGPGLLRAFDEVGLTFGDMDIFHHYGMAANPAGVAVFSVASLVEPGTFDPDAMEDFSTPGLALFMQLPGPVDGQVGLELMLNTGQRLKDLLGGELRDERRSVLTQQTIAHLRERIAEFNRRRLVPAD
ncbi:MAG: cell division protein ZipA [Gammaproteobacteria bacterium]|nr:cell division protein ZipA [Gammaproteobacteria bacterium]